MKIYSLLAVTLVISFVEPVALAETLQVPEGGKAISFGKQRVLCGASPEGWTVSADRQSARPPDAANETNRTVDVLVAADGLACTREKSTLTLIAVGQWPDIDPASVTFFPDEGRLEFKNTTIGGSGISTVLWKLRGEWAETHDDSGACKLVG
jgi:hypothetical protein